MQVAGQLLVEADVDGGAAQRLDGGLGGLGVVCELTPASMAEPTRAPSTPAAGAGARPGPAWRNVDVNLALFHRRHDFGGIDTGACGRIQRHVGGNRCDAGGEDAIAASAMDGMKKKRMKAPRDLECHAGGRLRQAKLSISCNRLQYNDKPPTSGGMSLRPRPCSDGLRRLARSRIPQLLAEVGLFLPGPTGFTTVAHDRHHIPQLLRDVRPRHPARCRVQPREGDSGRRRPWWTGISNCSLRASPRAPERRSSRAPRRRSRIPGSAARRRRPRNGCRQSRGSSRRGSWFRLRRRCHPSSLTISTATPPASETTARRSSREMPWVRSASRCEVGVAGRAKRVLGGGRPKPPGGEREGQNRAQDPLLRVMIAFPRCGALSATAPRSLAHPRALGRRAPDSTLAPMRSPRRIPSRPRVPSGSPSRPMSATRAAATARSRSLRFPPKELRDETRLDRCCGEASTLLAFLPCPVRPPPARRRGRRPSRRPTW